MISQWILLAFLVLAIAVAVLSWHRGLWQLPDHLNPWAPLVLAEPPGLLTRWKLARLAGDASACRRVLNQAPWLLESVPNRTTGPGCGFLDAVRIERTQLLVGDPFTLSCPAAVSLALWEQHVVLPAAQRHFGQPPARIEHFGSYACRNLYGREGGARSRHATANAFDVAGFVLKGGRRITIARNWNDEGPTGLFLREIHQGACRWFDVVLGPAYNAAHGDHLHLDHGAQRVCR